VSYISINDPESPQTDDVPEAQLPTVQQSSSSEQATLVTSAVATADEVT
jgi:hypothetical protein